MEILFFAGSVFIMCIELSIFFHTLKEKRDKDETLKKTFNSFNERLNKVESYASAETKELN